MVTTQDINGMATSKNNADGVFEEDRCADEAQNKWSAAYTIDGANCGFPKTNQDAHLVIEEFFVDPEGQQLSLLMVADGHGPQGHLVSSTIIEKFPDILREILSVAYVER